MLEFIAYQNPYSGGDAVYGARVMLGLDLADYITEGSEVSRMGKKNGESLPDPGLIVPNPNTGKMQYIYSMEKESDRQLQIFNARGCLVRSWMLTSAANSLDIDLNDQPSGFYVYRVMANGNIYPGSKIIIQK